MDPNKWIRIKAIFTEAADLPEAARAAYLDRECSGDAVLRQEVENLILQMAQTESLFVSTPRQALSNGDLLAQRFRIERLLGRGGMGEVYEATDLDLGGSVAVKVLKPEVASDPHFLARFRREVHLARQVTHPNVCRVFDVGKDTRGDGELTFLTMEYLDGETLGVHLRRRGVLTANEALPLVRGMIEGLAALHDKGLIHRDFKPGNVMIVESASGARAVLTDLGLARALLSDTGITQSSHIVGTPDYMAPEQLLGETLTPAADLYALGLVMYEMVTGKRPFPGGRAVENAVQRVTERPAEPRSHIKDIAPDWNRVIVRCLARQPEDRPQAALEILQALEGTVRMRPLARPRPPWFKTVAISLAAVALLAAGFRFREWLPEWGGSGGSQEVVLLPLNVAGGDAELEAFAGGLMETITGRLTQFEDGKAPLAVVPASEVRSLNLRSAREAKAKFNATAAVEGSLAAQGGRVRLTLTLIDTARMRQIETILLEDDRTNSLRLQDAAVARLANALNVRLQGRFARDQQEMTPVAPGAHDYYLQARGYLLRSDQPSSLDAAITLFTRSLESDGKFASAHSGLAEAHLARFMRTRDPEALRQAAAAGERGLALNPNTAETNVAMGSIHAAAGRFDDARKNLERAIELDSRNALAYQGLARVYGGLRDFPKAEAAHIKAISLRPGDWLGYLDLGSFYLARNDYRKAIAQFRRVVDLSPDNAQGYANLGGAYAIAEDWGPAEQAWLKAIAIDPKRESVLSNLGTLYFDRGEFEKAVTHYRRALDLNERNYRAWGQLGNCYRKLGDPAAAKRAHEQAVAEARREILVTPADALVRVMLGVNLVRAGRADWEAPVREAVRLAPDRATVLGRAAEAYELAGRRETAVELLRRAAAHGYPARTIEKNETLRPLLALTGAAAQKQ